MEPQKQGNSPRLGPEVVERQRIAKDRAAQRVRSCTVQNEMRGVLGQESARASGRIAVLPILERQTLNSRLCPLQRRLGKTQRT